MSIVTVQAFTRVDTHTGEAQTWFPGRRCFCEELVFVPGPNADTQEDDGFLLGMVYDAAKHKSFLAVGLLLQMSGTSDVHPGLASVCLHGKYVMHRCKCMLCMELMAHLSMSGKTLWYEVMLEVLTQYTMLCNIPTALNSACMQRAALTPLVPLCFPALTQHDYSYK